MDDALDGVLAGAPRDGGRVAWDCSLHSSSALIGAYRVCRVPCRVCVGVRVAWEQVQELDHSPACRFVQVPRREPHRNSIYCHMLLFMRGSFHHQAISFIHGA